MAETGCSARQRIGLVKPIRHQSLSWCRYSPVTASYFHPYSFSPITPRFAQPSWRCVVALPAAVYRSCRSTVIPTDFPDVTPWQMRVSDGCLGRENGLIGHLFWNGLLFKSLPVRPFGKLFQERVLRRPMHSSLRDSFQELPPRPHWGHSSATGRGEEYSPPSQGWRRGHRV